MAMMSVASAVDARVMHCKRISFCCLNCNAQFRLRVLNSPRLVEGS